VFNPLTIALVRPVTVVDKAETLFQNKRFKDAVKLLKSQKQLANVIFSPHPNMV